MSSDPSQSALMARQLRISGIVQGVGYRVAFERQAQALGLSGWVRNRIDGTVEALVAGDQHAVEAIIAWSQCGPTSAQVSQVDVSDAGVVQLKPGDFAVLPTA